MPHFGINPLLTSFWNYFDIFWYICFSYSNSTHRCYWVSTCDSQSNHLAHSLSAILMRIMLLPRMMVIFSRFKESFLAMYLPRTIESSFCSMGFLIRKTRKTIVILGFSHGLANISLFQCHHLDHQRSRSQLGLSACWCWLGCVVRIVFKE